MAGFRPFGMMNALAATTPEYKALVCIFLFGGNDSNNVLIPFDSKGYANYAKLRGALALPQSSLLQLGPSPNFAINPALPDIQSLYNSGNAAFVANTGPLVQPLTVAQYQQGVLPQPTNLFSHPDQQLEWQNTEQSGNVQTGWAGRIADAMTSQFNANASVPLITSVAGDTLFCNGASTEPVVVVPNSVNTGACSEGDQCSGRQAAEQALIKLSSGSTLVTADNGIAANADKYVTNIADALAATTPLSTKFPASPLGYQLQQIAQIINIRAALGVTRQIFFAGLGNFDTHSNQLVDQTPLLEKISPAMGAFYQATQELGLGDQITSFTVSDFARALQPNSTGGTDHGWGGHQLVFGGAVKGGNIYGTFPTLAFGGPDDVGQNGRWLPTTSSTQFAATLASWFGVSSANLATVFPLLGNFSKTNLGFV